MDTVDDTEQVRGQIARAFIDVLKRHWLVDAQWIEVRDSIRKSPSNTVPWDIEYYCPAPIAIVIAFSLVLKRLPAQSTRYIIGESHEDDRLCQEAWALALQQIRDRQVG